MCSSHFFFFQSNIFGFLARNFKYISFFKTFEKSWSQMRISWYLMYVHFTGIIIWKPPQLKDRKKVKDCVQYKEIMETFFWEIPPLQYSKGYYHKCMNKSKSRGFFSDDRDADISTCNLPKISYFESTIFVQIKANKSP